jgi:hypothetical protein
MTMQSVQQILDSDSSPIERAPQGRSAKLLDRLSGGPWRRHQARRNEAARTAYEAVRQVWIGRLAADIEEPDEDPAEDRRMLRLRAAALLAVEQQGTGGPLGLGHTRGGAASARIPQFAGLGKGRRQATDGMAWDVAMVDAVALLLQEFRTDETTGIRYLEGPSRIVLEGVLDEDPAIRVYPEGLPELSEWLGASKLGLVAAGLEPLFGSALARAHGIERIWMTPVVQIEGSAAAWAAAYDGANW